jgi:uncharacterized protein (DUF1330 family)
MRYYSIAELEITDPSWIAAYVADVTPMVERYGGRYLARTLQIEQIEGERKRAPIAMLIEWDSRDAAEEFYASEEYRPYRDARHAGSRGEFVIIAGEDVNGVARIER